jgi:hypothetical protein
MVKHKTEQSDHIFIAYSGFYRGNYWDFLWALNNSFIEQQSNQAVQPVGI